MSSNSMSSNIAPEASVSPNAQIGNHVTIEPFAVIGDSVVLEDHVTIKSHAYISGDVHIGESTTIYPGTCIGTSPQHLGHTGEGTRVVIGKRCTIREYCTINLSSNPGSEVSIGDHCFIMAYSHIAHNCTVGNYVTMANNATLAGHIEVEDYAIIGGMTPIHQFVRIGKNAMVGGMSRITHDVPPFTIGAGIPYKFGGLNLVGLKRRGFSLQVRSLLSRCFRLVYRSGLHLDEALETIEREVAQIDEVRHWVGFCRASKRGLIGLQDSVVVEEGELLLEEAEMSL